MKKLTLCAVLATFALGLCFTGSALAEADKGPADITLESTVDPAKKAKPSLFPHAKHQETIGCGDCHHGMDADGKQVAYTDGQEIGKCESCHFKAGKIAADTKLNTYKGAAHANCQACHKAEDKKSGEKKLGKCSVCHPKKK
ncbi:MAG: cytochrome c3 family protein [Thermodesulfobacteriota bacterium]|nr:cytochrome c3 family protein [Thermodesulfobacteriota bacterium]